MTKPCVCEDRTDATGKRIECASSNTRETARGMIGRPAGSVAAPSAAAQAGLGRGQLCPRSLHEINK